MKTTRQALFEIPMWLVDLSEVMTYHDQTASEVKELIDASTNSGPPRFLAHQTPSDPFDLPSPGWALLEGEMNQAYENLAKANFKRWRSGEFHLRRWAIRLGQLDDDEKARLHRDGKHNHLPALFSSIYYLSVPDEIASGSVGGTRFWNPIGNLMDVMAPRVVDVPAIEGRLVIFPSFLDHAPPPVDWDARTKSRIVVSTDLFYVSGQERRTPGRRVAVAAAGEQ